MIEKKHYKQAIASAMGYESYLSLLEKLVAKRKTTGHHQSTSNVEYTALNIKRMQRIFKTFPITPELSKCIGSISFTCHWLILSEGWCGDAAQHAPLFEKITAELPQHHLHIASRDENPEVMNAHLTNGSKSIPKLILLDDNLNVLANWGPRPAPAQAMMIAHKADPSSDYPTFQKNLQLWYAKDKGRHFQQELCQLLSKLVVNTQ